MPIKKGKAIRGYKQDINLACAFLLIQFGSVIILFSVGVFAPIKINPLKIHGFCSRQIN